MEDNIYQDLEKLRINDTRVKPPKAIKNRIIVIIAIVMVSSIVLIISRKSLTSSKQVTIITTSSQTYGEASTLMTAGGYIVAESEITVSSKVVGQVATLNVREGDLVHKGDIIATLDNEELRLQVEEAKANLKKATLNLKYKQELYEKDVVDLRRREKLFKENLISPSQLDNEEKNLVIAQLELDQARSELEVAKKRLQLAHIRYDESTIRAPITGTVIDKMADIGEMLFPMKTMDGKSGSAILTLADLRVMNVEVDINENDIEKIRLKSSVLITPDSFPEKTYQGEVIKISPMADRQKNVVPIKVRIKNPDEYLKPDMSAKVTFQGKTAYEPSKKTVMTIPRSAVVHRHDKNVVFVTQGSHAIAREIQLGTIQGEYVVVEKGLENGEQIVVEGHSHFDVRGKIE
jgi:HlyD family secretion protein